DFEMLGDILADAQARPPVPGYNSLSLEIQENLHPAFLGQEDPEAALEAVNGAAENALEQEKAPMVSTAPVRAPARKPAGTGLGERAMGRIFLAPSFAFMAVIALFPVFYAIGKSLYDIRGLRQEFIGFDNYARALTDSGFFNAVGNTFVFTVSSVSLEFVIGMVFALIMHQAFVGRGLTRAVILVPWVVPTAVAAQVWRYMFDHNPGFVNAVLGADINWLRD